MVAKMSLEKKSPETFIEQAKGSEEKVKNFLLRLPYDLWKQAKTKALEQDKTLHMFLLETIAKEVYKKD